MRLPAVRRSAERAPGLTPPEEDAVGGLDVQGVVGVATEDRPDGVVGDFCTGVADCEVAGFECVSYSEIKRYLGL